VVLRSIEGVHVVREVGVAYGARSPSREVLLFLRRSKARSTQAKVRGPSDEMGTRGAPRS
jgi:hypothetical protein